MNKTSNLYARIEPDIKEQAENILSALGIPVSIAINMFYKQIIMQRGMKYLSLYLLMLLLLLLPMGCGEDPSARAGTGTNLPPVADNPVAVPAVAPPAPEPEVTPKPEATTPEVSPPTSAPPSGTVTAPSGESHSWYFRPNKEHQPPAVGEDIQQMLAAYDAFYILPNQDNNIYLTFDEGYEAGYSGRILDILQDNQVKAAFFITGHYLKSQPELVRRMKDEGHLVCNHTLNHPDLSLASRDEFEQELLSLENAFNELTGLEIDKYLRPPMGNYSPLSLSYAQEMGYHTVFWSMAFRDWELNNQPGADYSYQHVIDNIHPGAVILLHAVSESNTDALDRIIKDLLGQGYQFTLFSETN